MFRFGPISFGKKQNPNMPYFTLHFTATLALKVPDGVQFAIAAPLG